MFCPRCGQPQPQDSTRFCPRCGCEVGAVKALVEGGEAGLTAATTPRAPDAARSRKDVTKGALFMFLFALAVAAATVDMPRSHSSRILFLTIAWLLLTLLVNLGPLVRYFFGRDASSSTAGGATPLEGVAGIFKRGKPPGALPEGRGEPAFAPGARPLATGEMIEAPGSVIEHTTNLLDRE